jgi:hypothetical protein
MIPGRKHFRLQVQLLTSLGTNLRRRLLESFQQLKVRPAMANKWPSLRHILVRESHIDGVTTGGIVKSRAEGKVKVITTDIRPYEI